MSRSENFLDTCGNAGRAIRAFRRGDPVLIRGIEDRNPGTVVVYPAATVSTADIARLRDAGGPLYVSLPAAVVEAMESSSTALFEFDAPTGRDGSPPTGPTVHYVGAGTEDTDRARTVRELAAAAADPEATDVESTFRVPGPVAVRRGAPGLLAERQGHVELSLALAASADQPPATAVCEVVDERTGTARPAADARRYGLESGLPYVDGSDLVRVLR